MAIGSDVTEITYNHPTLGSGRMFAKAGEDATINPGGVRRADEASGVDGGGNTIASLSTVRWSFEVVCAYNDNKQMDTDTLVALAESPEEATFTITFLDGRVYVGKGALVGDDLSFSGKEATFTLKLGGGGKLSLLK